MQTFKLLARKILKLYWYIVNLKVFLVNGLSINALNKFSINGKLFLLNRGEIVTGDNIKINSGYRFNPIGGSGITSIIVNRGARIHIGSNVGISNSAIVCKEEIIIEDNVLIGGDCKIYDTDFHSINYEERILDGDIGVKTSPVYIGNGAFIGTGSIILKGVRIGEKAVVAAGSIVTKDIPVNEIWGGNPIKFLKKIDKYCEGKNDVKGE